MIGDLLPERSLARVAYCRRDGPARTARLSEAAQPASAPWTASLPRARSARQRTLDGEPSRARSARQRAWAARQRPGRPGRGCQRAGAPGPRSSVPRSASAVIGAAVIGAAVIGAAVVGAAVIGPVRPVLAGRHLADRDVDVVRGAARPRRRAGRPLVALGQRAAAAGCAATGGAPARRSARPRTA